MECSRKRGIAIAALSEAAISPIAGTPLRFASRDFDAGK
jgi:hypothetical protein